MLGGDQRETFQQNWSTSALDVRAEGTLTVIRIIWHCYTRHERTHDLHPRTTSSRLQFTRVTRTNPPGISFMGRQTWLPGRNLGHLITSTFGISQREQKEILERISDAVADTAPAVREVMKSRQVLRTLENGC